MNKKYKSKPLKLKKDKKIKTFLLDGLFFVMGSFFFSLSVNMFNAPNQIAPGGVTGIATLINYATDFMPIGTMILVLNIPLFILSYKFIGKSFLAKTVIATVMASLMIDLTAPFIPSYSGDKLLAALFGGVFSGLGLGLVFLRGGTTGGTDILGKLIKLKKPHLPMGTLIMLIDLVVVSAAGIIYKSLESVLYSSIVFFISGRVINYLLYGTGSGKMLMVVTDKAEEITAAINSELKRGVSIIPVRGGYTKENKSMLLCVVRANEVAGVNKIILRYDENPFIIISEAGEVLGLGFKGNGA